MISHLSFFSRTLLFENTIKNTFLQNAGVNLNYPFILINQPQLFNLRLSFKSQQNQLHLWLQTMYDVT